MTANKTQQKKPTIAIVYDFDGTLSPKPMQEYTVLPALDVDPQEFWREVTKLSKKEQAEPMLMYMHLLVEKIRQKKIAIRREDFQKMGAKIEFFPGVEKWFDLVNAYVDKKKKGEFEIRHYVVSAGLKEILVGSKLDSKFHRVFASEYLFDEYGAPVFPKLVVTDTSKTQFLFRINKGKENTRETINDHMPHHLRPIPFSNMIYIGDGMTDVPSMAVVKQQGGHAIAVYNGAATQKDVGIETCKKLLKAGRVDFFTNADYRSDAELFSITRTTLDYVMEKMSFQNMLTH